MDFLRNMVSGNRKRYKQNGYDLDLTYITERIIAMSFPASNFESTYRNNIKSVWEGTIIVSGVAVPEGVPPWPLPRLQPQRTQI
ncbi:MAG: hypothetical protein P4M11_15245 [Candidatus Pacebacteria bacterium]|nr:hypothetical protein [Candidatus Paceibacterota bacterium]